MKRRAPERLAALLLCFAFGLVVAQLAAAAAPLRGLGGAAQAFPTSSADIAAWDALARELHPQVVRVDLSWPQLEPRRAHFDDGYIASLAAGIDPMRASGTRVLPSATRLRSSVSASVARVAHESAGSAWDETSPTRKITTVTLSRPPA